MEEQASVALKKQEQILHKQRLVIARLQEDNANLQAQLLLRSRISRFAPSHPSLSPATPTRSGDPTVSLTVGRDGRRPATPSTSPSRAAAQGEGAGAGFGKCSLGSVEKAVAAAASAGEAQPLRLAPLRANFEGPAPAAPAAPAAFTSSVPATGGPAERSPESPAIVRPAPRRVSGGAPQGGVLSPLGGAARSPGAVVRADVVRVQLGGRDRAVGHAEDEWRSLSTDVPAERPAAAAAAARPSAVFSPHHPMHEAPPVPGAARASPPPDAPPAAIPPLNLSAVGARALAPPSPSPNSSRFSSLLLRRGAGDAVAPAPATISQLSHMLSPPASGRAEAPAPAPAHTGAQDTARSGLSLAPPPPPLPPVLTGHASSLLPY